MYFCSASLFFLGGVKGKGTFIVLTPPRLNSTQRWQIGFRIASRVRAKEKKKRKDDGAMTAQWEDDDRDDGVDDDILHLFLFLFPTRFFAFSSSSSLFFDGRDFRPFSFSLSLSLCVSFFRFATEPYLFSLAVDCTLFISSLDSALSACLGSNRLDSFLYGSSSSSLWVWIMDKRHAALGLVLTPYTILPRSPRERETLNTEHKRAPLFSLALPPLFFTFSLSVLFLSRVSSSRLFLDVHDLMRFFFFSLPSLVFFFFFFANAECLWDASLTSALSS